MFEKISEIKHIGVFQDFEWDRSIVGKNGKPLNLAAINIFYGQNYSGKTTLSRIFRAIETGQLPASWGSDVHFSLQYKGNTPVTITKSTLNMEGIPPVRVFNRDFVRDNLRFLIDQDREIEPFAILGLDNISIQEEIAKIERDLGSNTPGEETGLYKELAERQEAVKTAECQYVKAEDQLDKRLQREAIDKSSGIKYQSQFYGDLNYNTAKLKRDIATISRKDYVPLTPRKIAELQAKATEQSKAKVIGLPAKLLDIHQEWNSLYNDSSSLVSQKIGKSDKIQELLLNAALNDWVKRGVQLLGGQRICAFCGNTISDDRWATIYAHFDEESRKLEAKIDQTLFRIQEFRESLQNITLDPQLFYSQYRETLRELLSQWKSHCTALQSNLDALSMKLQKRKENITVDFQLDIPAHTAGLCVSEQCLCILQKIESLVQENNQYGGTIEQERQKAQNALRLQEVYRFCETIHYADIVSTNKGFEIAFNTAKQEEKTLREKINKQENLLREQRASLSDETEGARRVNQYLQEWHQFLSLQVEKSSEASKSTRFRVMLSCL